MCSLFLVFWHAGQARPNASAVWIQPGKSIIYRQPEVTPNVELFHAKLHAVDIAYTGTTFLQGTTL